MNIETVDVAYNYFGDSVFTFLGETYNFYQHNCSRGRELVAKVKTYGKPVMVSTVDEFIHETRGKFVPALPYLEEMLRIHDEVYEIEKECIHRRQSAGDEIAATYGY